MLNISYTISPFLTRYGERLARVRQDILLHPLSPKAELSLQFQATISRLYFAFILEDEKITRDDIKKILANQIAYLTEKKAHLIKRQNPIQSRVMQYKQALDYINQEWLVSSESITVHTLIKLHKLASPGRLRLPEKRLQEVLDYLQTNDDNPFVQAAIAKLVFSALEPFTEGNKLFATLCSYLFLAKAGLDYRKLLILEEPWAKNMQVYNGQYKTALTKTNITNWLEFFVRSTTTQLEEMYQKVTKDSSVHQKTLGKTGELNDRQKEILRLFDEPSTTITNRIVQKVFKISQITASRDLAKLAHIGLLFTHGKGRAVRYTKV